MNPNILNRKGARKVDEVPKEVLDLLNQGEIETVNLTEWLAIDQSVLVESTFPSIGLGEIVNELKEKIKAQKKPTAMSSIKLIGSAVYQFYHQKEEFENTFNALSNHKSDTVRCYATYLISLNESLAIEEKLTNSLPLIADPHFGVREVVWMALRPEIDKNLDQALPLMEGWASNEDENVRRFITESTRPRGVWSKHIEALKENPEKALPILDKLKNDPAKYVQDSVGNWLNDASKSQPDFVIQLCERWLTESPIKATNYIVKKARRTIDKKK